MPELDESGNTKPEIITVKGNMPDNRVALYERHSDHPDGEAWVAGYAVARVAATPEVNKALAERRIVRTNEQPPSPPPAAAQSVRKSATGDQTAGDQTAGGDKK